MANPNSKLEWSKVTLDPLSALLEGGGDMDSNEDEDGGAPAPPVTSSAAALNETLGGLELNLEPASPSPPRLPPPPSLPSPPPPPYSSLMHASAPPSSFLPPFAQQSTSSRPDMSPQQKVGDMFNNLSTLISNRFVDSFSLSLSTSGGPPTSMVSAGGGALSSSPIPPTNDFLSAQRATVSSLPSPSSTLPSVPPAPSPAYIPSSAEEAAFPMLTGEQRLASLPNLYLQTVHGLPPIPGQLLITTYKIQFLPTAARPPQLAHLPLDYFRVPMACIDRTEYDMSRRQSLRDPCTALVVHVKDGRVLRVVAFEPPSSHHHHHHQHHPHPSSPTPSHPSKMDGDVVSIGIDRIKGLIDAYAFPENIHRHLFCFEHHKVLKAANSPLAGPPQHGENYNMRQEFLRQFTRPDGSLWLEMASCPWRWSRINEQHALCASYPSTLIVPAQATEEELWACAAFRSEQRLPALTWGSSTSSASIWRASQPKVGMSGASCVEDEKVLRLIGAGELSLSQPPTTTTNHHNNNNGGSPPPPPSASSRASGGQGILRIMDLRSNTAALANRARGYGYESTTNYPTSTLAFCNIGHIHAMRESQTKLFALVHSKDVLDVEWSALVEGTKWLTHVRLVLNAAYRTAHAVLREKTAVLLHCSHGWDRTSQVSALAQLFLDPFYRTIHGFQILVEKDFAAFGHPFQLRTAHGLDKGKGERNEEQLSPIFLQFLDCVYQLVKQHPNCFEYTSRYLLCVAEHLYDCRFGNFLCNTPKDRAQLRTHAPTASLWTLLEDPHVRPRLTNPSFGKGNYAHPSRLMETPLPSLLRRVSLWNDYWLRWSAKPCHPPEVYVRMRRAEKEQEEKEKEVKGKGVDVSLPWVWVEEEEVRAFYQKDGGGGKKRVSKEEGAIEGDLIDLGEKDGAATATTSTNSAPAAAAGIGEGGGEEEEVEEEEEGLGEKEEELLSEFM